MSELAITGTVKKFLDVQSGIGKKSGEPWTAQEFVVANNDGHEGKEQLYCFKVFGEDKVDQLTKFNKVDDDVKVFFNVSVNEYNDKYYTSLNSWRVEKLDASGVENDASDSSGEPDDLPF